MTKWSLLISVLGSLAFAGYFLAPDSAEKPQAGPVAGDYVVVLYACPPQGGVCERVSVMSGHYGNVRQCEHVAIERSIQHEGDRWMTKPGWEPLFSCQVYKS